MLECSHVAADPTCRVGIGQGKRDSLYVHDRNGVVRECVVRVMRDGNYKWK